MGSINRVWVMSELYYPEETGTGHLVTCISEALAGSFDVRVLTAQPTYSMRGKHEPRLETHNGVHIRRCRATTFDKNVLALRIVNLVTISVAIFLNALLRVREADLVLVVTNPPSLPFLVAFACRLHGASCVVLVHDVYPEVMVATGMKSGKSFMVFMLRRATRWLYRSVRCIVAIGRDMQRLIESKVGPSGPRVVVLPNWADEEIRPKDRSASHLLSQTGLGSRFVVEYAGNIGPANDFETLLRSAEILQSDPDIHFLILGWGSRERWLKNEIARIGLANVTMVGRRPRSEQNDFLAAADLAVITLRDGMLGVGMPSRTYNTMASQRAILAICEPESELWMLVNEAKVGWAVRPGDVEGVVSAIRSARLDSGLRSLMGVRARTAATTEYSRSEIMGRWSHLFKELAGVDWMK